MDNKGGPSYTHPDVEGQGNNFTERKKALRTSFRTQANALLRKNLIYQKRNCCTNCCLIFIPIFLCVLLFLIQTAVNNLIANNECGCKCLQEDAVGNCVNKTCGIQYSTNSEAPYCPIDSPTEWPAFLQVPEGPYRAVQSPPTSYSDLPPPTCKDSEDGCPATILYTGANRTFADAVAGNMLVTPLNLDDLLRASQNGSFLPIFASVVPATGTDPWNGLYSEPALFGYGASILQSSCLDNYNITYNSELNVNGSLTIKCLEGLTIWRDDVTKINEEIYKGYYQARVYADRQINQYSSAYDFSDSSPSKFNPVVFYNYTLSEDAGGNAPPPKILRLPRAMNLASNAFMRTIRNGTQLSLLFVKDYPKPTTSLNLDFSSILGPLFFEWLFQLLLPVIARALVYEKSQNLRTMMKMHGLGDRAYWSITYLYFLLLSCMYGILTILVGSAINLKIFRLNNYAIQIIFYFIFLNSQVALGFLLSTFFSNIRTVTVVTYLYVIGSGLLGAFLYSSFLEDLSFSRGAVFAMELIPGFALYRGIYEFGQYAFTGNYLGENGMQFSNLGDKDNGIVRAMLILLVEWAIALPLAYYLDQVVASGSGVKRHPLFFLPGWLRKHKQPHLGSDPIKGSEIVNNGVGLSDVEQEISLVDSLNGQTDSYSIVCDRLRKIYPPRDGNPEKVAVKGMSVAISRGECFGMLGPNGAGKTTSINMMIGFLTPSSGTATVEGLEIGQDMDAIYSIMGVCPQHDLLWEQLTGREHLYFYGRLKNLRGAALDQAVEESLKSVNLWAGGVGDKRAGKYSGGMKRRLSVAISLVGNPLVVYMDEPSTGLDPASRKSLWTAVKAAKQDRAIILTTHSMEEAEALCDRLGIFVSGEFQCIGNPKELTSRYGGSFVFTVTTPPSEEKEAEKLALSLSRNAQKVYHLSGTQKFELPTDEVDVADVFTAVERAKSHLTIQAWGISNTTLEDVFIKVAKGAVGGTTLN